MSRDIYVQVQRAGVQKYASIYAQLDNLSQQEASYFGGAAPYERFDFYTLGNYDIRQFDLLINLNDIDPLTTAYFQYRVISIPEPFPDNHIELIVDIYRGN